MHINKETSYVRDTYITNYFYFFDGVVKLLGGI